MPRSPCLVLREACSHSQRGSLLTIERQKKRKMSARKGGFLRCRRVVPAILIIPPTPDEVGFNAVATFSMGHSIGLLSLMFRIRAAKITCSSGGQSGPLARAQSKTFCHTDEKILGTHILKAHLRIAGAARLCHSASLISCASLGVRP